MLRMRRFEGTCVRALYQAQKIKGFLHLYDGEEAVATGVMSALDERDAVVATTYREHSQSAGARRAVERAAGRAARQARAATRRPRRCLSSTAATPTLSAAVCRTGIALPTSGCVRAVTAFFGEAP